MNHQPPCFVILADESAVWRIAGIRQFERLLLAINECVSAVQFRTRVQICWKPGVVRQKPSRALPHLQIEEIAPDSIQASMVEDSSSRVFLPTTLVLGRRVLGLLIATLLDANPTGNSKGTSEGAAPPQLLWEELSRRATEPLQSATSRGMGYWEIMGSRADLRRAEKNLLLSTRKPVDGFVSRYLNRPVSRFVSRFLVKTAITPNQWTSVITTLAIPCFLFLSRGDYLGFVVGAFLYHLNSVLDGCDGEIARLKYLDSKTGDAVDGMCDFFINLIYVLGVGVGLSRQTGISETQSAIYFWEGMTLGACSVATEGLSSLFSNSPAAQIVVGHLRKLPLVGRLFRRPAGTVRQEAAWSSGLLQAVANSLIKVTKRDVYAFVFVGLAVIGYADWSLHFIVVVVFARFLALLTSNPEWSPENSGWRA